MTWWLKNEFRKKPVEKKQLKKPSAARVVWSNMAAKTHFSIEETDRIIQMAWEDRTPFEAIRAQFSLAESGVIDLMRRELERKSFDRWRRRVHGRATKHAQKRGAEVGRFRCSRQRDISQNKIT